VAQFSTFDFDILFGFQFPVVLSEKEHPVRMSEKYIQLMKIFYTSW